MFLRIRGAAGSGCSRVKGAAGSGLPLLHCILVESSPNSSSDGGKMDFEEVGDLLVAVRSGSICRDDCHIPVGVRGCQFLQ